MTELTQRQKGAIALIEEHQGEPLTEAEIGAFVQIDAQFAEKGMTLRRSNAGQIGWGSRYSAVLVTPDRLTQKETPTPPGGR